MFSRFALASLSVAALLGAVTAAKPFPSVITSLTNETFDSFIDENEVVVVEFIQPWCDYCKTLRPEYERVPELADTSMPDGTPFPAVFTKVDLNEYPEFEDRFNLEIFPTFKLFVNGLPEDMITTKTGEGIVAATRMALALEPTGTFARSLDSLEDTAEWLFYRGRGDRSMQSTVMGFFPEGFEESKSFGKNLEDLFEDGGAHLAQSVRFGRTSNPDIISAFGYPADRATLVLYKDFDEGKEVYEGKVALNSFVSWIKARNQPLAVVIDRDNIRRYQNRPGLRVLVHMFVDERGTAEPRSRLAFLSALRTVGRALEDAGITQRGEIVLSIIDAEKNGHWMDVFGLPRDALPAVALADIANDVDYSMPGVVGTLGTVGDGTGSETESVDTSVGDAPEIDSDRILEFCKGFYAGVLSPASPAPVSEDL